MNRGHRGLIGVLLVVLLLAACSDEQPIEETTSTNEAPSTATRTTFSSISTTEADFAPPPLFVDYGITALELGESEWEDVFVGPGALVEEGGEFHLFYPAVGNGVVGVSVGYAATGRLEDGFFRRVEEPLFVTADAEYLDNGPNPSSALVADDGTWMLFFNTSGFNGRRSSGLIGRATAPGPEGPWTVDPEPVLLPGETGEWDDLSVRNPYVIAVGDGYRMYYAGDSGDRDAHPDRHIGMASSDDGATWTKNDDPVLAIGAEGAWDEMRVFEPVVLATDDGFVMFYASSRVYESEVRRTYMYGYAVSDDGINWDRPFSDPVFTSGDNYIIFGGRAAQSGDDWYLVYGVQTVLGTPSSVGLAVLRGPLPVDQ